MYDFLTMEQSLGFNLDDYTYAEASQMFAEHGRETWQHTSAIIAYLLSAFTDPKKGKRLSPTEFNPWEGGKRTKGVPLTRDTVHLLRGLAHNVKGS